MSMTETPTAEKADLTPLVGDIPTTGDTVRALTTEQRATVALFLAGYADGRRSKVLDEAFTLAIKHARRRVVTRLLAVLIAAAFTLTAAPAADARPAHRPTHTCTQWVKPGTWWASPCANRWFLYGPTR